MSNLNLKPINAAVADRDVPSRSWVYRQLRLGAIKAKKSGCRTLLDMESVAAAKASLPDYVPLSQRDG
jgi:hypothetical protein